MTASDRDRDVRHQQTSAEWRNVEVPQWVPRRSVWRMFVAGLAVMIALTLSTVLVWVLLTVNEDDRADEDCRVSQENRVLIRSLLREADDLIPNDEYQRLFALAQPIKC